MNVESVMILVQAYGAGVLITGLWRLFLYLTSRTY
jgi:hypothetical protein